MCFSPPFRSRANVVDGTIEDSRVEDLSDRTEQRPINDVLLQRDGVRACPATEGGWTHDTEMTMRPETRYFLDHTVL
jgi:hypothetical protein